MEFPFYDAPNTATISCCHIIDNGKPILYVSHRHKKPPLWYYPCGGIHKNLICVLQA